MDRLEVIRQIEELQLNKNRHEEVLKDIKSIYCSGGELKFEILSTDFNRQYEGDSLKFDKVRMRNFLEMEIMILDEDIYQLVKRLHSDY